MYLNNPKKSVAYILVVNRGQEYESYMGDMFDVIPVPNDNIEFYTFEIDLDTALDNWDYLQERIHTAMSLDQNLFLRTYDECLDSVLEYWMNQGDPYYAIIETIDKQIGELY